MAYNIAQAIFKFIDVAFYPFQNYIAVDGVECERDLKYGEHPLQKYDLYWKPTQEPMPVLVNIHGGGFVGGDKMCRDSISELYADRGYLVVNMNYRLSPEFCFPANVEDAVTLIDALPALLGERFPNADFTRVVVTGDSAGAYMAAGVGCAAFSEEYRTRLNLKPITHVTLAGIIAFCGPYDLPASLNSGLPFAILNSIGGSFLGFEFEKGFTNLNDYPLLYELSPIHFVNKNWCRCMLTYAEKDIFCKGQGERMLEAMRACGVDVIEHHSTKLLENHCYHFNFWTKISKEAMAMAYQMLDEIRDGIPHTAPQAEPNAEVAAAEAAAEVTPVEEAPAEAATAEEAPAEAATEDAPDAQA